MGDDAAQGLNRRSLRRLGEVGANLLSQNCRIGGIESPGDCGMAKNHGSRHRQSLLKLD
jgi:hypothetical protein